MTSKDSLKTYIQDSTLNTLQNSYCYELRGVNFCGTSSPPLPANAHCTIETSAQPLPDAVNVSWNKYVGWIPEKYLIYRVKDYGTAGRKLLATVSGSATSYLDTAMFCTDPNTYRVEAVRKGQPSIISRSDTAIAAPLHQSPSETVNARVATVVDNEYVRLEWDIPTIKYAQTLHVERSVLGEPFKPFAQYPIDKAPAALNDLTANVNTRAYQYQIAIGNRCNERTTQGRMATSIFLQAKREQNTPTLRWNPYEAWENGVENYHIEVLNEATQAFEPVATLGGSETVFADDKTRLPQAHYCYRVWAQERGGNALKSLSNEACLPVPPTVFPPNAFTPNADGDNDVFIVPNAYVRSASLKIFSRWNEPVFETDDLMSGWDGVYKSIDCPEGVYPFVIDGIGWDGSHFHIIGTVTLLR
jgi:gliding motility-associated-like protein